MGHGTITAYALVSLEPRGTLFVTPGMEVVTYFLSFLLLFSLSNSCQLLFKYLLTSQKIVQNFYYLLLIWIHFLFSVFKHRK